MRNSNHPGTGAGILALAIALHLWAQPPANPGTPASANATQEKAVKGETSASPPSLAWTGQSTFLPIGKRDPFKSPLDKKKSEQQPSIEVIDTPPPRNRRPLGPPGTLISEIKLMGIAQGMGSKVALINCGGTITYFLREGDRLYDGSIKEIHTNDVKFIREIKSQNRIVRQQEVIISVNSTP